MGVFGHGLWRCPSSVGCLWCSWLGFGFGLLLGRVWFRWRPACPPPFPVRACGVGVCVGPGYRLCPALLCWVVGVCFLRFCFFFFFFSRLCGPCPSIPFLSGWAGGSLFFFFFCSVSLFPVGRCHWLGVAGFGWVVPLCLCGGPVFGAFWGGVWPPVVVLVGGLAAVGCFRAFSPSPLLFFFSGRGGLPVPPSAFSRLAHALACIQCCPPGCCLQLRSVWPRSGPMGRVGYVHGRLGAPFLPGLVLALPAGRLRQAGACGFGLGGWGCSCPFPSAVPAVIFWVVRHRCRLARCGPVCGLRAGVWRAGAAPSRLCGGWLRLVPQVRVSCVVLCRSVPRRVASCCGALHCGALWCGVPWSRVVPRWVSGGQPGLCRGAECGLE